MYVGEQTRVMTNQHIFKSGPICPFKYFGVKLTPLTFIIWKPIVWVLNKYIWRTVFSPFPQVIDVTKHQNNLILFIKKSFLILQRKCHHPKLTLIFPSVFLPNVSLAPDLPKWNKRPNIHDIKYYYCLHMVLWDNLLYVTSGPNFVLSCQLVPRTSLLQYCS